MESFPVLIHSSTLSSPISSSSSCEGPSVSHQRHSGCQARVGKTTITHLLQKKNKKNKTKLVKPNAVASNKETCKSF